MAESKLKAPPSNGVARQVLPDKKREKKFLNLLTKITNVFNEYYILKTGYCVTLDKEKPFIVVLDEDNMALFKEVLGEIEYFHVLDNRKWKKALTDEGAYAAINDYAKHVTSQHEKNQVMEKLESYLDIILGCEKWESFMLSQDEEENAKLLNSLFNENEYIMFKPVNTCDSPDVIITKAIFPLAKESNVSKLYYSIQQINEELYCMVCDFQFDLFRVHGIHYFIGFDTDKTE